MRMMVPPKIHRRSIDRELVEFFHSHRKAAFNRAVACLCRYFAVRRPRISWFEYIDWGKAAGKTYEDGRIHLVHPENWKRGRIHNSERMWVQMIYHEMGHYLFWTDAERKADAFMRRMVTGLRTPRKARRPSIRGARKRRVRTANTSRAASARRARRAKAA
ncbi:MAG: hypothetical protein WBE78_18810 [Candidatus Binataceae bacterium]